MHELPEQLEVLRNFTQRLDKLGLEYMLTGSMAQSHYAIPRSTVDIDIVLAITSTSLFDFFNEFENEYYIPTGSARNAVDRRSMFNVLNIESLIKIDCIVLKNDEFERTAFSRRRTVQYVEGVEISIISKEDLIISKLNWSRKGGSMRQLEDVASIMRSPFDREYVESWVAQLGLETQYADAKKRSL